MSDVLEGGPSGPERSPPPRWVWVLGAVVALAAVAAFLGSRSGGPGPEPVADGPSPQQPIGGVAGPTGSPGATTRGACGYQAEHALMQPGALHGLSGRVLVGGHGVHVVDLGNGTTQRIRGIPVDDRHVVSALVRTRDGRAEGGGGRKEASVYALSSSCRGEGHVYRIAYGPAFVGFAARRAVPEPVDSLLAGAREVWAVRYATDVESPAPGSSVVLHSLATGRTLTLPAHTFPVAAVPAGLVVASGGGATGHTRLRLADTRTGRTLRPLGTGEVVATSGDRVLLNRPADCRPPDRPDTTVSGRCVLTLVDARTGAVTRQYPLPPGRTPAFGSVGAASRDGRFVAFLLGRAHRDPRFGDHPMPPADVAVLYLQGGGLQVVPGLELPPKSGSGLGFDPTGQWVMATVSEGDHTHLLAWRLGLDGPEQAARLPGLVAGAPPVLNVPD